MIKIYPSKLNGTLDAAASKAHAQRLLFMAAMAPYPSCVKNVPMCDDIETTLQCLLDLGCKISVQSGKNVYIDPFPKNVPVQSAEFDFRGSSTTCRIALALSAALGIRVKCTGSPSLQKRRLLPLTSRMALRGVHFSNFSVPCEMEGRLEGGEYQLDGNEGSQNISALLMALPLVKQDSTLKLSGKLQDSAFVELTIRSMEAFGVRIEKIKDGYFIPGRQKYQSPGEIDAENDWGLAAMWITASAACGDDDLNVTVRNLPKNSPQNFRDIHSIIALLHFDFTEVNIDASKCPDLATLFAALAIVKGANMEISGIPQLKFKESDRLKTMRDIARTLGQNAEIFESGIRIIGTGAPNYAEDTAVNCQEDPWVFMSMVLASAAMKVPYKLENEKTADKVYRGFLDDFARLGGKFEIC